MEKIDEMIKEVSYYEDFKRLHDNRMNTDDYKKRFTALFQEMEEELGKCQIVEIERCDETSCMGETVKTTYKCRMEF